MMKRATLRLLVTLIVTAVIAALVPVSVAGAHGVKRGHHHGAKGPVELQIIQYSDWHGAVEDAAVLSAHFAQERANNPNTIVITGGDDFGGSDPISSLNDDVPAVLAQNQLGLDVAGLGNHNFDRGLGYLQDKVDLAEYQYVAANLTRLWSQTDGIRPLKMFRFEGGIKVAVIGVVNPEAPTLVLPGAFGKMQVTDPAAAAMKFRARAEKWGADIFVLVGHMGVRSIDEQGNPSGELIDLANAVEGFDVILGDHTDISFIGEINGAIVAEAESRGDTYNRISLKVKRFKGTILESSVESIEPDAAAVTPDPVMEALIKPFADSLAERFDGVIGQTTGFWPRASSSYERIGEAELGNLFAGALLDRYPEADVAFQNAGGIRSPLGPSNYTPADPTADRDGAFPDDIVLGDVFALETFGNVATTQTVTGAQLWAAVEFGIDALPDGDGKFPQIAGFSAVYDSAAAPGSRLVSLTLDDGTPIANDGSQSFVMVTNNFVASGGDGYDMLADPAAVTREPITTVLAEYIEAQGTLSPEFQCRMVDLNPAGAATSRADNPLGPPDTRPDCP